MARAEVWEMHVYLHEGDAATEAHVAVVTPIDVLWGRGRASRRPGDPVLAQVGDDLSLGRALADLSLQLLTRAELELSGASLPTAKRTDAPSSI